MSDLSNKQLSGCATVVFQFPAAIVWYVLFGLMLHRTNAGVAEWSLYVGYLICSVAAFATAILFHVSK